MRANSKTILISVLGAVIASIIVQQIAYRNSLEFKVKEALNQGRQQAEQEESDKCDNYKMLKKGNPQWEPVGDYYDICK